MKDQNPVYPEPWLTVGEDPLTGLPNLLAFISDLPGSPCESRGVAVGFDLTGLRKINEEEGQDAGDRVLVDFAQSLTKAASHLGFDRIDLYRLGSDEFCAIVRGSKEDACGLAESMGRDASTPAFRYSMAEFSTESTSWEEAFFEIWAPLQKELRNQRGVQKDPMRQVAHRLVEQVRETVEQLKVVRRMAYTDDISGLPNQRAARFFIKECLAESRDGAGKLSLLFVDGDNLRRYNDDLGYGPGNEMIRRLGAVLSGATLPNEMVARWLSGDEFMIVLPGYDKALALDKAQSVRSRVRKESLSWIYPVTVSIGVATYPDDANDLEGLLRKAEEANAKAKDLGKDRVCGACKAPGTCRSTR